MLSPSKRRALAQLASKAEALKLRTQANQRRVVNALEASNADMVKVLEGYHRLQQELREVMAHD